MKHAQDGSLANLRGASLPPEVGEVGLDLRFLEDDYDKPDPFAEIRPSLTAQLLLGVYAPFALFTTLLLVFTYGYHITPLLPWVIAIIGADVAIISAWPPPPGRRGRSFWDFFPLISCLIWISAGVALGLANYQNILPWVHANQLHEYSNVRATATPETVSDAGVLNFAVGTELDTGSAAGYYMWPYTYCAAPILAEGGWTAGSSPPIGFWAVGVGCCDSRSSFECGGAKDPKARSGLRLEQDLLGRTAGHDVEENYKKAVRMSASSYGLVAADDPVFVVWHKDPHSLGTKAWWVATIILVVLMMFACCGCFACTTIMKQVWQLHR